jgi:alanine dehydrogenase
MGGTDSLGKNKTLLLARSDIAALMPFEAYMDVVERAFLMHAEGKALPQGLLHIDSVDGEFHIKAGGLQLDKRYFALKVNGGFFHNAERFGIPNIQGAIFLCDGENGYPLGIMDSTEITIKRTAAAAAVAAKYLARSASATLTVCGCGRQGGIQLSAMHAVLPIQKAYVFDVDAPKAQSFARRMSERLRTSVVPTIDLAEAMKESDVCVTCTPSRQYYLEKGHVSPGTFIAAIGADSPDKQELDPELLKSSKVVVDILEQCAQVGELHHALEKGMRKEDVHAELGEIIAGRKPGRSSEEEIIIFDATGTALQDVAAAAAVYESALRAGKGTRFDFFQ